MKNKDKNKDKNKTESSVSPNQPWMTHTPSAPWVIAKILSKAGIDVKDNRVKFSDIGKAVEVIAEKVPVSKNLGVEPIRNVSLVDYEGKEMHIPDGYVNWKSGLLFYETPKSLNEIEKLLKDKKAFVKIGNKYWPALQVKKMGSGSNWSFVLDYDEDLELDKKKAFAK